MSTRQERLARRRARIERQADALLDAAVTRVVNARPAPPLPQGEATPEQVREMRDKKGMTWMAIGKALGLPGAKYGAGRARQLYAAANNGNVPRKYAPRKGTTPKPTAPGMSGTKTDRKIKLVEQGHVIPRDMPDEEVEGLIRGRTIEWAIDMAKLTNTDPATWGPDDARWCKQEARVHPEAKWVYVGEEDSQGNRVVRFREYLGRDQHGRLMAGPTRTVRVDAIHTIR